jgi:pimeloyl-ACP methyl ester carboxylesterase
MADEEKKKAADTKEEPILNPRPFPTTPRSKDGVQPRIFALLIGINDYQGTVTKLGGCINDVNLTANYLRKKFGDDKTEKLIKVKESVDTTEKHGRLYLRILTNAKATYAAIINAFEDHLINGGGTADDTFWFHFSGHGTEQFTAAEFSNPKDPEGKDLPSLEPNGKDQSLVCYNPGGTQSGIFLADKELAAMIDTLYKGVPTKEDSIPHIVFSLDCCHSGSGTRDFQEPAGFKSRHYDFLRGATTPELVGTEETQQAGVRGDGVTNQSVRPLDSYYNNYYSNQKANGGILRIPQSRHVLLSACSNVEKAGDLPAGGVFSSSLISALTSAATAEEIGTLNYADLFKQTRSLARSKRNAQSPQFEPIAGFNPHTAFLEGWSLGKSQEYEVVPNNDKWFIRCGAIHGFPTDTDTSALPEGSAKEIIVKVYKKAGREFIGFALVKKVGVQESELELLEDLNGKLEAIKSDSAKQDDLAKEPYIAEIFQLPGEPFYVHLDGSAEATAMLRENWSKIMHEQDQDLTKTNIFIAANAAEEQQARARVVINDDGYQTWEVARDRPWGSSPLQITAQVAEKTIVEMTKGHLRKIARWTRLLALKNEASKIKDDFKLELFVMDYAQWVETGKVDIFDGDGLNMAEIYKNAKKFEEFPVRLQIPTANFITPETGGEMGLEVDKDTILFGLRLYSNKENRFYYLYDFKNNAAIDFVLDKELNKKTAEEGIDLLDLTPFEMERTETEGVLQLKLLVTQKQLLDKELLVQSGLDADKGMGRLKRAGSTDGWDARTLKMTIVRQQDQIKPDKEASLADGNITIKPRAGVKADLSVTATTDQETSRSLQVNPFQQIEALGINLVDFRKERSLGKQNVLELSNLEVESPESLVEDPLQILLNDSLTEEEVMVPVTFDGEFLRVIGDAEQVDGKVQVNIRSLPETKKVFDENGGFIPNPLGTEEDERSLIKGLKMVFMKWSAKREEDETEQAEKLAAINKLCWVKYYDDGTIERMEGNVPTQVKVAKNILLTVHGIIGDTEVIAANVPNMVNKTGESIADKYDLVLTYDYENLNTPIAETAEDLQEKLAAVGIDANSGKKITILAHSMGGLVSRHLVEKLGGAAFVKHLVMAGTPNAGSPFGNVPGYLSFATNILDIAFNFLPILAPASGALSKGLKALGDAELFETLEQMKPGSPFLEELNNPNQKPDGIKYSILAGDVSKFKVTGGRLARFIESSTIAIGNLANKPTNHDIAVSVDGILNEIVWTARKQTVSSTTIACHHLNYFITDVGQEALAEILG